MRTDSARFHQANTQLAKEPRHVVNIEFPTASIYCTSHGDISGVPGVVMNGVLQKPIVVSQRIVPDEGRSEIGSASFRLIDLASVFTDDIRAKLAAGNGLRRRRVRFYRGFAGFAWADMQLIQTQIVRDVSFDAGVYQVDCNDVTREQRKDVFTLGETTLTANVSPTDTTINVNSTAAFTLVVHDASYTDAPSSTVGYIRIKDERIRYTGKTSTTFTGCTRAVFGTRAAAYTVDAGVAQDRREKVTEYVYLEVRSRRFCMPSRPGSFMATARTCPQPGTAESTRRSSASPTTQTSARICGCLGRRRQASDAASRG